MTAWLQDYGLVFDITICLLLVTTIAYAMMLNRKLSLLRDAKRDMEKLFAEFAAATNEAQGGLLALKQHSGEAGESLAKNVDDACRLADEMAFLVKKGNEIANRLEAAISASREVSPSAGAPAAAPPCAEATQKSRPQAPAGPTPAEAALRRVDEVSTPVSGPRGIAKLARRKLSNAESELMRTLQAIR